LNKLGLCQVVEDRLLCAERRQVEDQVIILGIHPGGTQRQHGEHTMPAAKKRKRAASGHVALDVAHPVKKPSLRPNETASLSHVKVQHPVLSRYYTEICTLRDHLLLKLPKSSRLRRKKLNALGTDLYSKTLDAERAVVDLLDSTLVCTNERTQPIKDDRREQWVSFSQRGDESYVTISAGEDGLGFSQSEVSRCRL
jgi:hypothetical protein